MELNPECKIFIGGLNKKTTSDTLKNYFQQFGKLVDHVVITDRSTKSSRGFGFVTYETLDEVEKCLEAAPHTIDDRTIDIKRAVPKDFNRRPTYDDDGDNAPRTTKVFLGGLPLSITKEEISEVMEEFGAIEEVVIIQEKKSTTPRGFGFVIFQSVEGAAAACKTRHIKFKNYRDRDIEVKPAKSVEEMNKVSKSRGREWRGESDSRRYSDRDREDSRMSSRGDSRRGHSDDYYRHSDPYYSTGRYMDGPVRGGGGRDSGYIDRGDPYGDYIGRSSEYGGGMDRYEGDYRSYSRPLPPPYLHSNSGSNYGDGYGGSSGYGPGPGGPPYGSDAGSRDYMSGSRGYDTGTTASRGYGGGSELAEYGTGSSTGFETRPPGDEGSDLGGYGYSGYPPSGRGGSGVGPIKSRDRPLLSSRGGMDGREGPYGGMGITAGAYGSARNPMGGASHGYHPYKR